MTIDDGPSSAQRPPWRLLTLEAPLEAEDAIARVLCALGALGVEVLPPEGAAAVGGPIVLRAWFDAERPLPTLADLRGACTEAGRAAIRSVSEVHDGRWVERWMETLGPIEVGERLRILPVPDPDGVRPAWPGPDGKGGGRLTLRIVPGRAFGTGEHATTRLCLEALESLGTAGTTLLDVGTGSGILAIAAAALGCRRAVGIDLDGEALRVARRNVLLNAAGGRVALVHSGPEAIGSAFDRVVANLNAAVLEEIPRQLLSRLAPGGRLILSGMLEGEAVATAAAYAGAGAEHVATASREGWACTIHRVRRA